MGTLYDEIQNLPTPIQEPPACRGCGKECMIQELSIYGFCADCDKPKETRIVNAKTGGEKGQKLARFDLLPWDEMTEVAELYGRGAAKYADRNWEKGYDWSLSFASLMRHATEFWQGEYMDEENQCAHLASVVFHALALMQFYKKHPELDDRPNSNEV